MTTATLTPGAAGVSPTAAPAQREQGVKSLSSEDFFRLLVAELQQQDPLEPNKTSDMITQVSQIRGIELSKNLTDTLDSLAKQQRLAGTTDMIGKLVKATLRGADGATQDVSGVVTGVRFEEPAGAVLELDNGQSIRATDVTHVAPADDPSLLTALVKK